MNKVLPYNFTLIGTLAKSATNAALNKAKNIGGRVLDRAIYGYNDYNPVTGANKKSDLHKNLALRSVEGGIGGGLIGATAGTITGHIRRKQAMEAARREAMQGTKNKILNALDRHRLRDIGNEAARSVSITKHALAGAGIGAGIGAGSGALETYIKHKLADKEYQNIRSKIHNSAVKAAGTETPDFKKFVDETSKTPANTYFEGKKGLTHKQRKEYKTKTYKALDDIAQTISKGPDKSPEEPPKSKEPKKEVKQTKEATTVKTINKATQPTKTDGSKTTLTTSKSSSNKSKSPESILGKILSFFSRTNNIDSVNFIQFSRCIHEIL